MTQVRTHTRQTKHGRVKVEQHTRADRQAPQWFQPRRAWRNAKRSRWSLKNHKRASAALFGAAAVSEILGFAVFKGLGALFIVAGVCLAAAGYGMKHRT